MTKRTTHSYFVVMQDFGKRGREAVVDPEITAREVISRIRSGEYPRDRINFIHYVVDGNVSDVTENMLAKAAELEVA